MSTIYEPLKLTVEDARHLSREFTREELKKVTSEIEKACKKGDTHLHFKPMVSGGVVLHLQKRGFNVVQVESRNNRFTSIEWK